MKRLMLLVITGLLVLVPAVSPAETLSGKVVKVPSGDAIVVEIDGTQRTFVLAGIISPTGVPALAEKAKKNLSAKVKNQEVRIQTLGEGDKRGTPAAVWVGKRSINTEMVRAGWARHDTARPEYKMLARAEDEAKAADRGV
ncbi:MAG: thermonuclease family protein, partial [Pirellulales bacterium]|nr:thermonuclease family protein [Pirellulales bacterium]